MRRGIVTAFGAAGFISWTILHTKEMLMSLADSIRRRTDEWVERKRREGRLDELLDSYAYQPSKHETQYLENRG